jgi:hypothetical protein
VPAVCVMYKSVCRCVLIMDDDVGQLAVVWSCVPAVCIVFTCVYALVCVCCVVCG